ncbi:MAG TPA: GNAT family N-acetyltransferase [Bryobacteraceae bacterium]|nr:GNAT family N-acetyltransferase [Bryobacteraceae bacterium]
MAAPQSPSPGLCEFLDWDSRFFGLRIGRIVGHGLRSSHCPPILDWACEQRLDCLYFLADIGAETIRLAEEHAFHLIDLRVTLAASPRPAGQEQIHEDRIRPARSEDVAALRAIAGASHTDTRFYQDGRFPAPSCDEMYRVWIEKSCHGYADWVWVAEHQGQPAGYITCHLAGGEPRIGLTGVAAEARGTGLGHALVQRALAWFSEHDAPRVTVATQGANSRALRLYQHHGFATSAIQLWYHKWFPK